MIANPVRGEVELKVDGELKLFKLTLNSLACLEKEIGVDSFAQIIDRFSDGNFTTKDIIAVLNAGYFGANLEVIAIENSWIDGGAKTAARAAVDLLKLGFGGRCDPV